MSEKQKLPARKLSVSVEGNPYDIEYPNVGQMIEIESLKIAMTRKTYADLVDVGTISGQLARYSIDMIAFLQVCCPQMKKDLKVETFSSLDAMANKKLLNSIYIKKILPWLNEWETVLNAVDEEEEEKEKKEETPSA